MDIRNLIIHKLNVGRGATPGLRDQVHSATEERDALAQSVVAHYQAKVTRTYGSFASSDSEHSFKFVLRQFMEEQLEFVQFTRQAMALLTIRAGAANAAKEGFVMFLHYSVNAKDYLLVVVLSNTLAPQIDEKTYEILNTEHVDLTKLRMASRIDISATLAGENNRNISFIKGRGDAADVSQYFTDFIGCVEDINASLDTRSLVQAVRQYAARRQMDADWGESIQTKVYDHCSQRIRDGERININSLAASVFNDEQEAMRFVEYLVEENGIPSEFEGSSKYLKPLRRLSFKDKDVSISFSNAVYGERVTYNESNQTLTIRNVPPKIIKDDLST